MDHQKEEKRVAQMSVQCDDRKVEGIYATRVVGSQGQRPAYSKKKTPDSTNNVDSLPSLQPTTYYQCETGIQEWEEKTPIILSSPSRKKVASLGPWYKSAVNEGTIAKS
jgi:hypothetical protein